MTQRYPLDRVPCTHPDLDALRTRDVGRLCDACLCRLHEIACDAPVPYAWIDVGPPAVHQFAGFPVLGREFIGFKLDVSRARCLAAVVGLEEPTPRELELLPVAASVVARCDDALRDYGLAWLAWQAVGNFVRRGVSGDDVVDALLRGAHVRTINSERELCAVIDRLVEEASA